MPLGDSETTIVNGHKPPPFLLHQTTLTPELVAHMFLLLIHILSLPYQRVIGHPYHSTLSPKPPPSQSR
jgi:hypothetical protein